VDLNSWLLKSFAIEIAAAGYTGTLISKSTRA